MYTADPSKTVAVLRTGYCNVNVENEFRRVWKILQEIVVVVIMIVKFVVRLSLKDHRRITVSVHYTWTQN